MDFASQAHRDKLNLKLRHKLFTTRCSSPLLHCFTKHKPIPVPLQIPLRARYRRIPLDWSIARGNATNTNSYQPRITVLGVEML